MSYQSTTKRNKKCNPSTFTSKNVQIDCGLGDRKKLNKTNVPLRDMNNELSRPLNMPDGIPNTIKHKSLATIMQNTMPVSIPFIDFMTHHSDTMLHGQENISKDCEEKDLRTNVSNQCLQDGIGKEHISIRECKGKECLPMKSMGRSPIHHMVATTKVLYEECIEMLVHVGW